MKQGLAGGMTRLGLEPNDRLILQLEAFAADLIKWNKTYNLTAIKTPQEVTSHHLLDSLSIHAYLTARHILDVGAGGGLPAIPLAMLYPEIQFTLLDSNGKKTRFLQQMVINHGLKNCQVVQSRVEDYPGQFEQVTCRAFASLADISQKTAHLLSDAGQILAMKGRLEEDLNRKLPATMRIEAIHPLKVPGVDAERHLVILRKEEA